MSVEMEHGEPCFWERVSVGMFEVETTGEPQHIIPLDGRMHNFTTGCMCDPWIADGGVVVHRMPTA